MFLYIHLSKRADVSNPNNIYCKVMEEVNDITSFVSKLEY